MGEDIQREQDEIHTALKEVLHLQEGEILTGWVVCFETMGLDGVRSAGHLYGPEGQTPWGATGLIEWAKTRSIPEGSETDEDDED